MAPEIHPEFETLLLWQTGELEPSKEREVQRHIASCVTCREKLRDLDELYSEGDWASSLVAERSMRARVDSEGGRYHWIRRTWPATIAAVLIAAVFLYTITGLTPEARADTLLSHAVMREAETPFRPHILRIDAQGKNCKVILSKPDMLAMETAASGDATCASVNRQLEAAGWNWNTALSPKTFQHWRASLTHKHDAIHKTSEYTEVSTRSEEGPVHEATLRLRNTDYQAIGAKVQFAPNGLNASIEIEEMPYIPQTEIALAPAVTPTPSASQFEAISVLSPLDHSEAEARLALHRIGADTNILLAIDRQDGAIRVWGVAPTPDTKASIARSLATIPYVSVAVVTEEEQRGLVSPLPWQGAHGGSLPLAYEQVNDLFKNNDEGRQNFLNDLDAITRRILGEAKARDALLALAAHDRSSDFGTPLRSAADDLRNKLLADQGVLIKRVAAVCAALQQPILKQPAPLSYQEAAEVYLLIHRLFIADDTGGATTAELALGKLEKLPL